MRFFDAHCHLQDSRLGGLERVRPMIQALLRDQGVARWVVNGTREADWPAVEELAAAFPDVVLPSFGLHPWYVSEAGDGWKAKLQDCLDRHPQAAIGEIGLDRWIEDRDEAAQEAAFCWQLDLAAERALPASIHCLRSWGWMLELLHARPVHEPGLLVHSYGGSLEMAKPLAAQNGYFSFCGYFLHERKHKTRDVFQHLPLDRLLIETDAPDQRLPEDRDPCPLVSAGPDGERINHPGTLPSIYEAIAELRSLPVTSLAEQVEANFHRLFGHLEASMNSRTLA